MSVKPRKKKPAAEPSPWEHTCKTPGRERLVRFNLSVSPTTGSLHVAGLLDDGDDTVNFDGMIFRSNNKKKYGSHLFRYVDNNKGQLISNWQLSSTGLGKELRELIIAAAEAKKPARRKKSKPCPS